MRPVTEALCQNHMTLKFYKFRNWSWFGKLTSNFMLLEKLVEEFISFSKFLDNKLMIWIREQKLNTNSFASWNERSTSQNLNTSLRDCFLSFVRKVDATNRHPPFAVTFPYIIPLADLYFLFHRTFRKSHNSHSAYAFLVGIPHSS